MRQILTTLADIMDEEKALYEGLLAAATEKQDVLVRNDMARLGDIMKLEQDSVDRLMALDKKKTDALSVIGRLNAFTGEPDVAKALSWAGDCPESRRIEALLADFAKLAYELSARNGINQRLIETHLRYSSFCIEMMTQQEYAGDFYGSTGQVNEEQFTVRRSLIDKKV